MKATLEFNLPEEQDDYQYAMNGVRYSIALRSIMDNVFRPARKHGYPDEELNELIETLGEQGRKLVSLLEKEAYEIINDLDVDV